MEPLSVGASVIAVVGATGKVIKGIRRLETLRDAPRGLDDLLAEVSQFELVIQAVQKTHEEPGSELKRLLETAQRILFEIDLLIEYKLTEAGTSNKVDRWQWTRSSKEVEQLRGQLRDVTTNLVALVGVNTSTNVLEVSQVVNKALSEQRQFSHQILAAVTVLVHRLEESPSTRAVLTGPLGNIRQLTLEPASQASNTVANIADSTTIQAGPTAAKLHPRSRVHISQVQRVNICDLNCACSCHARRQLGAPGILSKVFGRGYIEIAGSPILRTRCDTELCRAHAAPRVSVRYHLPQWLASRMIFMWFTSSPPCSPEFLLRVPCVREFDNAAFEAVRRSDIKRLKSAITVGDCTPYDVDEYGDTLLSHAVKHASLKMLFYLSNYSDFCNPSSVAPWAESTVWEYLVLQPQHPCGLCPDRPNTSLTELFPMVDWEWYIVSQTFTTLHQIVCGLSGLSLDVGLQGSTSIDELDRDGRSALWYAVTHRRLDYVRRLLEQGANPNIGAPPLWVAAAQYGHFAMTEMLLNSGSSLSPTLSPPGRTGWLLWPDEYFNLHKDSLAVDELLVRHGIDLNHRATLRGVEGVTILMRLAASGSHVIQQSRLIQLIQFGADIEITDEEGKTAIMYAVQAPSGQAFAILARAGARLDLKTVTGSTILHFAIAYTADYYTYLRVSELDKVMRDADFTKIDVDAKDEDGNRAYDTLRIRNGPNWDGYCKSKGIKTTWTWQDEEELKAELEAISTLENLLHHVQESQGVPEADRYPPLGEYLSRDGEEEVVPGAWPAY